MQKTLQIKILYTVNFIQNYSNRYNSFPYCEFRTTLVVSSVKKTASIVRTCIVVVVLLYVLARSIKRNIRLEHCVLCELVCADGIRMSCIYAQFRLSGPLERGDLPSELKDSDSDRTLFKAGL